MASSTRLASSSSLDDASDSFSDWMREHGRALALVGVALAAVLVFAWIWRSTSASKAQRAEQQFFQAQAPLAQNDLPGAERELRRVAEQFDGTAGGAQAQLLLAQVLYEQGKYQAGIDALKEADDAPGALRSSAKVLTAAGYEGLGKPVEAARLYEEAAGAATGSQRDDLRASAARAYQAAGNGDAARKIWEELAKREGSPLADEARVRLGELSVRPAGAAR